MVGGWEVARSGVVGDGVSLKDLSKNVLKQGMDESKCCS